MPRNLQFPVKIIVQIFVWYVENSLVLRNLQVPVKITVPNLFGTWSILKDEASSLSKGGGIPRCGLEDGSMR